MPDQIGPRWIEGQWPSPSPEGADATKGTHAAQKAEKPQEKGEAKISEVVPHIKEIAASTLGIIDRLGAAALGEHKITQLK